MSGGADAERLRASFDESAEAYERVRPVAPPELFDDLVSLARLRPGARLLEIGCGTGQATVPLAERGFALVAVELGERLAEIAGRKLARFPRVEVVTSSFERWDPRGATFDGVVAFNSFHWLDPDLRFAKPAALLRAGGALAVVGMRLVEHADADPAWLALQDDFEAAAGVREPRARADAAVDRTAEFEASGSFRNVRVRHYAWDITFDADAYVSLLRTSSWLRPLPEDVRRTLFERVDGRIRAVPGQTITPTMGAVLYVAERA